MHAQRPRRRALDPDAAFTLIEVLVVVIIVGILAAVAVPVFLNQRAKGVDASLKADLRAVVTAQETWLSDRPTQAGTDDPAALAAAGFRKADPVHVVRVHIDHARGGYCLWARAVGDSMGGGTGNAIFYDSLAGGFLNNGRHLNHSVVVSTGVGACGNGIDPFTDQ